MISGLELRKGTWPRKTNLRGYVLTALTLNSQLFGNHDSPITTQRSPVGTAAVLYAFHSTNGKLGCPT